MKSVEISNQNLITLFGAYDCNAKHIEQSLNVRLIPFDGELKIESQVGVGTKVLITVPKEEMK